MTGLRERKKQKTREAIQQHALRLFHERGYEETTVEQIAAAAEVSPSTLFRYFATKEDLVLYDPFDPIAFELFEAQPKSLAPIAALRKTLHDVYAQVPKDALDAMIERERLTRTVPALKSRMLDAMANSGQGLVEIFARRVGRPVDDPGVVVMVGAVVGIALMAYAAAGETLDQAGLPSYLSRIDGYLAELEKGLPFS